MVNHDTSACSFCHKSKTEDRRIIKGTGVYICEPCVDLYYVAKPVAIKAPARRCSFCKDEQSEEVDLMGLWAQHKYICRECLLIAHRILHPARVEERSTSFAVLPRIVIDERPGTMYVDIRWSWDGVKSMGVITLRYVDESGHKPFQDILVGVPRGIASSDSLLTQYEVAETPTMDVLTHPLYPKARELILEVTGFEVLWG